MSSAANFMWYIITPDRQQSKTLLTIDERGSKITRNSVFISIYGPTGKKKAFKNSVSNNFWSTFVDSINIFDCHLSGVIMGLISFKWQEIPRILLLDIWGKLPCSVFDGYLLNQCSP